MTDTAGSPLTLQQEVRQPLGGTALACQAIFSVVGAGGRVSLSRASRCPSHLIRRRIASEGMAIYHDNGSGGFCDSENVIEGWWDVALLVHTTLGPFGPRLNSV